MRAPILIREVRYWVDNQIGIHLQVMIKTNNKTLGYDNIKDLTDFWEYISWRLNQKKKTQH